MQLLQLLSSLALVSIVTGCAAPRSGAHAGLEDRLTAVEHRNLVAAHPTGEFRAPGRAISVRTQPTADGPPRNREHLAGEPSFMTRSAALPANDSGQLSLGLVGTDSGVDEADETVDRPATPQESRGRLPPLPSLWDTIKRDVRHMPRDLWRDTKRVYGRPANLVILGAGYGAALTLQQTGPDDTVEDHFRYGHHHFKEDWREAFGAIGNPGIHFALAGGWYLLGQQTHDQKTYEVGKTLFSALIINNLTVLVGYGLTSDRSPNGEWGAFPSGHTSSSFAVASVLHEAYGHVVGVPLYGLATLVAIERVDDREHYLSDVVMGAVLGTVVGHAVASGRDPEFFGWKLLPFASPESGASGVALMKSLP